MCNLCIVKVARECINFGTLTLFNNNIEYKLSKVKVDRDGNYNISKILFALLVHLYGPNKTKKP